MTVRVWGFILNLAQHTPHPEWSTAKLEGPKAYQDHQGGNTNKEFLKKVILPLRIGLMRRSALHSPGDQS